nr:unnamed protein product [Naegleria fowleri]
MTTTTTTRRDSLHRDTTNRMTETTTITTTTTTTTRNCFNMEGYKTSCASLLNDTTSSVLLTSSSEMLIWNDFNTTCSSPYSLTAKGPTTHTYDHDLYNQQHHQYTNHDRNATRVSSGGMDMALSSSKDSLTGGICRRNTEIANKITPDECRKQQDEYIRNNEPLLLLSKIFFLQFLFRNRIYKLNNKSTEKKRNLQKTFKTQESSPSSSSLVDSQQKNQMKLFHLLLFLVIYCIYSWYVFDQFQTVTTTWIPFVSGADRSHQARIASSEDDFIGSYLLQDVKFCISCKINPSKKDSMIFFTENVNISSTSQTTQLLLMAFGNSDFSSIDLTFRAPLSSSRVPTHGNSSTSPQNYLLILSSTQVLNFNIILDANFPLSGIVSHSPLQNSVLVSWMYSSSNQQFPPNIPITYLCRSGDKCTHDILTEESTFKIENSVAFARAMSQQLGFEWRAFMSCEKGTRLQIQPKELPCVPLTDEVIIYLFLVVLVFVVAFLSCMGMILLRWYCVKKRQRQYEDEEQLKRQKLSTSLTFAPPPSSSSFLIENGDIRVFSSNIAVSPNRDDKV